MDPTERLLVWAVGFLAGIALGAITFGDGWGRPGREEPHPTGPPSIRIPDTVPDWLNA